MIAALKKNLTVNDTTKLYKDDEGALIAITIDGDKGIDYYHVDFPKVGRFKIEANLMYIVKCRE
jgi:hypothetical protein